MEYLDAEQWALPFLDCEFKFEKIEEEDILKLLRGLDVNKALGLDNISAKLLRMAAPVISHSLASFNFSLESGQVAGEWKFARVTLVPKRKNSEGIDNFRPVSVLPVVAKVFERIFLIRYMHTCRSTQFSVRHNLVSGRGTPHRMCR